jgi:hypothetical protein
MEEFKINNLKVTYNPEQVLFTPENSPVVKKKVEAANEMLRKTGLPKFKYVVEK